MGMLDNFTWGREPLKDLETEPCPFHDKEYLYQDSLDELRHAVGYRDQLLLEQDQRIEALEDEVGYLQNELANTETALGNERKANQQLTEKLQDAVKWAHEADRVFSEQERDISSRDQVIEQQRRDLDTKSQIIEQQQHEIATRNQSIEGQRSEIAAKEQLIKRQQFDIDNHVRTIDELSVKAETAEENANGWRANAEKERDRAKKLSSIVVELIETIKMGKTLSADFPDKLEAAGLKVKGRPSAR